MDTHPPLGGEVTVPTYICLPIQPAAESPKRSPKSSFTCFRLTGYEGKALLHRLGQGALMRSLLPAEPRESGDVQHKQIQDHLPTVSAYKNFLVISHGGSAGVPSE